jgi:predicted dehydrogenase
VSEPLRVAMIGLGVISRYYAAALPELPELELVAVCDRDDQRTAGYAAQGVPCDRDYRETLARPEVEAVLVNLPNHLHFEVAAAALSGGRHVCCEKPLTLEPGEAARLAELARERGVTLFTAFHRRYNRNLEALRPELERARIVGARARYFERIEEHAGDDAWYLDPAKCGGGALADNGPNAIDALRAVLGPLDVVAARLRTRAGGVDVQAEVELISRARVPARVELDWAYDDGELKDLTFDLADGSVVEIDLLAGYPGFKSSLYHEYVGVLRDFAARVADPAHRADEGVEIVDLVARSYAMAR